MSPSLGIFGPKCVGTLYLEWRCSGGCIPLLLLLQPCAGVCGLISLGERATKNEKSARRCSTCSTSTRSVTYCSHGMQYFQWSGKGCN